MADDTDNADTDDAANDAQPEEGPRAGERLGEARRLQEITVAEIAKELHLDEYKIRALETNQFDVLGAPVFAKGHLKKYAGLVGVSSDDVLADYYVLTRAAAAPPVVGEARRPAREIAALPWLFATAIVIGAAVVFWYVVMSPASDPAMPESPPEALPVDGNGTPRSGSQELQTSPESPDGDLSGQPAADSSTRAGAPEVPADDMPARTAAELTGQSSTESAVDAANAPAPAANNDVQLSLRFSGDCWTEISDSTGRRLFFGLARDGRNLELSGPAPVSALFGNANNVAIRVNGEDYSILNSDRRGRTAQLTFQAPSP